MPASCHLRVHAAAATELLAVERAQLAAYASRNALTWQDDPSNAQLRFDRNYLRARVVPALRERWPAVARTAGRSARHCAVAAAALIDAARRDLESACDGPDLEIAMLRRLPSSRRAAVLRLWIADRGFKVPEVRHLHADRPADGGQDRRATGAAAARTRREAAMPVVWCWNRLRY